MQPVALVIQVGSTVRHVRARDGRNDQVHAAGAMDIDFKTDVAARSRATSGSATADLELRCSKDYLAGDSAIAFNSKNAFSNLPPIILSMLMKRQNALAMKFFSPVTVTVSSV